MLDLKRCGQFISNARKEKGMTQKQLADEIGVSDKAISRWETGRGMPDTGTMPALCKALDMNINELLSGERLSVEAYSGKAEDNMVKLMEDNEEIKRGKNENAVGTIIGVAMLLLFIVGIILFGLGQVSWFIDMPSLIAVLGIHMIIIGIAGQFSDYVKGIKLVLSTKGLNPHDISETAAKYEYAVDFGIKTMLFSGAVSSIINIVLVFGVVFDDISKIGPTLAVAVLTAFYAVLFALILMVVKGRLHNMI